MSRSTWASTDSCASLSAAGGGAGHPELRERAQGLLAAASSAEKCLKVLLAAGLLALFAMPASAQAAGNNASQHHVARHRVVVLGYGAGYSQPDPRVRTLQRELARAGFSPGPVDGRYGPETENAVIRFQAAHRMVVDGIAGPLTQGMLRHPGHVLYPGTGYGTSQGSMQVRELQRRLSQAGFSPGPIDGRYGPETENAVARYQASHGLAVDGIAGPVTISRINQSQQRTPNQNPNHHRNHTQNPNHHQNSNHNQNTNPKHKENPNHNHKPSSGQHAPAHQPAGSTAGRSGSHHRQHANPGATAHPQPSGTPKQASPQRGNAQQPTRTAQPGNAQHPGGTGSSSGQGSVSMWLIDSLVALVLLTGLVTLWLARRRRRPARRVRANRQRATNRPPAPLLGPARGNGREVGERPEEPLRAEHQHEVSDPAAANEVRRGGNGDRLAYDVPRTPAGEAQASDERPVPAGHAQSSEAQPTAGGTDHQQAGLSDPNRQRREQAPGVGVGVVASDQPTDAHQMFWHGQLLEQHGDLSGAIRAYRRADRLGHGPAATNLGLLLEQQGDRRAAWAAYRRAYQRGDAHGAFNLGALLEEQGQLDQASLAYQRADDRGHPAAATNLGVLLEQQGELPAAEACYRRADQRGDAHGAFNLAVLLEEKGDQLGAMNAYRRASHRGHKEITELARAAMLDLKQHPQHRLAARKGGERNGQ